MNVLGRRALLVGVFALVAAIFVVGTPTSTQPAKQEKHHGCACALTCMDGRVQQAVADATRQGCKTCVVDVITQAGMVKVLADNENKVLIENFRMELRISVERHGTRVVSISAHDDCAGNPASKEQQLSDLRKAKKTVESWGLGVEVVLLWVAKPFQRAEVVE